jgi:cyclic beta-1,2-glucan synthetase
MELTSKHTITTATIRSNGALTNMLTPSGGGFLSWHDLALTRWMPDATRDSDGLFVYVQDMDSGALWSAGFQPIQAAFDHYEAYSTPSGVTIKQVCHDIASEFEVGILADQDVEIRTLTLQNQSDVPRRLCLTSYAEIVLNHRIGDAGHPAFSKLFVQTDFVEKYHALTATRRLRSPDDAPCTVAHWLLHNTPDEWETDRLRFLGRGRTTANPQILGQKLSQTVGNVLDAVFSLRKYIELQPNETKRLTFAFACAETAPKLAAQIEAVNTAPALKFTSPDASAVLNQADSSWMQAFNSVPIPKSGKPEGDIAPKFAAHPSDNTLQFANEFGGFSADGKQYVMHIRPDSRPPLPWTNVISNEKHGIIVSESGACYSWSDNSRENRLTPWFNDPVSDPSGEALYIRDEENGAFWSPTPAPAPPSAAAEYKVTHGFGYSSFLHESHNLIQETTFFVPRHDPLKIVRLSLKNTSDAPRKLSLFSFHQLVMGGFAHLNAPQIQLWQDDYYALFASNSQNNEFAKRIAFAQVVGGGEQHISGNRRQFLGEFGRMDTPELVAKGENLKDDVCPNIDPAFVLQTIVYIEPNASKNIYFIFGQGSDQTETNDLLAQYQSAEVCEKAFAEVQSFWSNLTDKIQVETPSKAIDLMLNGWLVYQNLSCRIMGRSAFYQSGGAFGYRDQLQDTGAMIYHAPELTRSQILLHAAHQFPEGDVLHWWHPPLSKGIRTRFSDDLLWLPYITAFYLKSTGDNAVLNEQIGFKTARLLEDGEDEIFVFPEDISRTVSVYEHCCMALDKSLTKGAHGLPLMGTGDWNDGMSRVGREGKGESVWLGFFLYHILDDFIPISLKQGDTQRVAIYSAYQSELKEALNAGGWDGEWYRRAYYDNGAPLGSKNSDECQIDTIAQAWAIISKAAPPERAENALSAMEKYLVSEKEGIVRLLTPAFDQTPHDPGYIKGYVPGVRENGGQYTHGALWAIKALAELGRGDRAGTLLEMISPISHATNREDAERYMVEPYVIAADVYGVAPHIGRGGWTWYTGSAGWMYRVALESVLGLTIDQGKYFVLNPCIPKSWGHFKIQYQTENNTCFHLEILNPDGVEKGVVSASINGEPLSIQEQKAFIPIKTDGAAHHVQVVMGL